MTPVCTSSVPAEQGTTCSAALSASERARRAPGGVGRGPCSLVLALVGPARPTVLCPLKARPQQLEMHMRYGRSWAICTAFQGGH